MAERREEKNHHRAPGPHVSAGLGNSILFWGRDEGMGNRDWNDKELGVLSVEQV